MTIKSPEEVKKYYQEQKTAKDYINRRFTEPLNVIEHEQQIFFLNHTIKKTNSKNIVEFAPGPARVTVDLDITNITRGLSLDASKSMLSIAKERMQNANKRWQFKQADLLSTRLNLKTKADLIFCFRFLLHFHPKERTIIYQQAKSNLKENGFLIFEAMNKTTVKPLRFLLGKKRYFVYDKLYTKEELKKELSQNGFKVLKLHPIIKRVYLQSLLSRPFKLLRQNKTAEKIIRQVEKIPSTQPYEWIVVAQKKNN